MIGPFHQGQRCPSLLAKPKETQESTAQGPTPGANSPQRK